MESALFRVAVTPRTRVLMGARALAFILAWPFVVPALVSWLEHRAPFLRIAAPSPGQALATGSLLVAEIEGMFLATILTALLLLTEREGAPAGNLHHFPSRSFLADGKAGSHAAEGAVLGALTFGTLMAALFTAGAYHLSLSDAAPGAMLRAMSGFAILFAAVGFTEEFIFRGYLQRASTDALGFWAATVLTSVLFGVAHASGIDTLAGAAGTVLFGLFACLTLRLTGSLWFAIGWHSGWDFTETAIFGTPNGGVTLPAGLAHSVATGPAWLTGGQAGPEGSIVFFVVQLVLVLIVLWMQAAASSHDTTPQALAT